MILLFSFTIISIIATGLYIYFIEYLNGKILYYTIPIVYILSFIASIILLIIFLMISLLFRSHEKNLNSPTRFHSFFTNQVAMLVTWFFRVKVYTEGMELLPKDGKFMLMSNHQSLHDPIATVGLLRKYKISFIMKDGLMKIPFIGRWLSAAGFLPIDRKNDRNALKTIIIAGKRLAKGDPIGVYPEGTRSGSSEINQFRNGIFKLAQKAEAPIVVCLIDNFYVTKKRWPWRRTKALFKVCKVINYEEIKDLQTNDIGDMCRGILLENQKLAREKYSWIE